MFIPMTTCAIAARILSKGKNLITCGSPGEDGNVWAFNFFFYNKKLKRIAYFSCRGISKTVAANVPEDSGLTYNSDLDGEEEAATRYGMANEMDL